jgi:hypothetical protein
VEDITKIRPNSKTQFRYLGLKRWTQLVNEPIKLLNHARTT